MSARSIELNYTHFCIEDRNYKLYLLFILMQVCKRDAVALAVFRVFLPSFTLDPFSFFSTSVFHSQWTQLNPWVSKFLVGIFCFKESGSSWCEVTVLFEWQTHKSVCQFVWALENPNCMTFLWHCVLWSTVQSKACLAVWRLWDMQTLWCMGSFLFAA